MRFTLAHRTTLTASFEYTNVVERVEKGHSDSDNAKIAILFAGGEINVAPTFNSTAPTNASDGAQYLYNISTSDTDADALTITATTKPSWLTFTDYGNGTARLVGTPGVGDIGGHSVVLSVSDGTVSTTQSYTILVAEEVPENITADSDAIRADSGSITADSGATILIGNFTADSTSTSADTSSITTDRAAA